MSSLGCQVGSELCRHDVGAHPRRARRSFLYREVLGLLLAGVDIRQIQEYLGHANVETTMIYTHVVKDLRSPARSPLDALLASRQS